MPTRVDPCLATLVDKLRGGAERTFEVKRGGYRPAVHIERAGCASPRGGYDGTDRFAPIAIEARQLGHEPLILTGEAVVLDERGAPTSDCCSVPSVRTPACAIPARTSLRLRSPLT